MEMGSTSSVKGGVKAKLGLAFLSQRATGEELDQGSLSQIDVEGIEPIVRQIYIIYHRGRTLSPVGMEFLRFLKRKKEKN
jgi:DNA-binding transcriptional LysR family regulator